MRKVLIALFITCTFLSIVQAQDKTVRIDTINIRGIVLDEFGKPVPMVPILSKNKKLLYPNHEFGTSSDRYGKFELNGALVKDTITIDFFDNNIRIINNGSRFLEIHLPPVNQKNPLKYFSEITALRKN